jgi:hypothetical protein
MNIFSITADTAAGHRSLIRILSQTQPVYMCQELAVARARFREMFIKARNIVYWMRFALMLPMNTTSSQIIGNNL